jgi:hypothetical protein
MAWSGYGKLGEHFHRLIQGNLNLSHMFSAPVIYDTIKFPAVDWQRDVVNNPNIDAVYIASPDFLHTPQAIDCLQAGKHVLLEKPVYNFDSVMAAAVKANRILQMNLHRRYDPQFYQWRKFMQAQSKPVHKILFETFDPNVPENDTTNIEE